MDDFLEQLDQVKNLGPLDDIMKMIPGMNKMKGMDKLNMDEKQIDHIKAIIQSMTPSERENPAVLNVSRKTYRQRFWAFTTRSESLDETI